MNTNEMNDRNIFFLDFTFNRKLRILQQADQVTQLRKKEADVLALLCQNYPNPVSQEDFLMKVWGGGYVTPQSIAQVIRSLRCHLGDDKKSTIATIPKLGYKLTITPTYEEVKQQTFRYAEVVKLEHEHDNFSYAEQQTTINAISASSSISILPYSQAKKKFFSPRRILCSSLIFILASLVGFTLKINNNSNNNSDNSNNIEKLLEKEKLVLVNRKGNIFYEIDEYLKRCDFSENTFVGLLNNNTTHDCFIE